jgi:hypothetical protein
MEYRVEPTPLDRGRSRRVVLVTTALTIVVGSLVAMFAVGGRTTPEIASATAIATPAPVESASQPAASRAVRSPAPAVLAPGRPPRILCHDVAGGPCAAIARAVLAVVVDPALPWPTRIDVWSSLLCGSTFDCPPGRLAGRRPAGSAVVVVGRLGFWVNVTGAAGGSGAEPGSLEAWVIRSAPVS